MERQLEDKTASLLKSMGFKVSRNVRLSGRSGLSHESDLTFEADGNTFIVECKNHFSREDILSIYGKATDLDVSHIFLVGQDFPPLGAYPKRFDLSLLVLNDNPRSEDNFRDSVRNIVGRTISEKEKSLVTRPSRKLELNSFYFAAPKAFDLKSLSASFPKGDLLTSGISNGLIRIDSDGPKYRVTSFLRATMREKSLEKIAIPEISKIKPFLETVEESHGGRIVRFGMVTSRTYLVANIRYMKDRIRPDELSRFLSDREGKLTSIGFRLPDQTTFNIARSPSLNLGYRGKFSQTYADLRKDFEKSCLRDK